MKKILIAMVAMAAMVAGAEETNSVREAVIKDLSKRVAWDQCDLLKKYSNNAYEQAHKEMLEKFKVTDETPWKAGGEYGLIEKIQGTNETVCWHEYDKDGRLISVSKSVLSRPHKYNAQSVADIMPEPMKWRDNRENEVLRQLKKDNAEAVSNALQVAREKLIADEIAARENGITNGMRRPSRLFPRLRSKAMEASTNLNLKVNKSVNDADTKSVAVNSSNGLTGAERDKKIDDVFYELFGLKLGMSVSELKKVGVFSYKLPKPFRYYDKFEIDAAGGKIWKIKMPCPFDSGYSPSAIKDEAETVTRIVNEKVGFDVVNSRSQGRVIRCGLGMELVFEDLSLRRTFANSGKSLPSLEEFRSAKDAKDSK